MWQNGTLVFLEAPDIDLLKEKLDREDIIYSSFIEPDIGNKLTAIATTHDNGLFKKYKLIGH